MSKVHQKIREIIGDIEIRPTQGLSEALLGQGPEQPSEWMML